SWSGAVGKAIHDLMAIFDGGGNLAEQMSHAGNFFVNVLGGDMLNHGDPDEVLRMAGAAGMNTPDLEQRQKLMRENKAAGQGNKWDIVQSPADSATEGQWHGRASRQA